MRKLACSLVPLVFSASISFAQVITNYFGTGANTFAIEFVQIGNPNNTADTGGEPNPAGSVPYDYWIGKYEVSREMVLQAIEAGGLDITLADMTNYGGNGLRKPAQGIGWYEAAKFVNYLNASAGKPAAYKFDDHGNFQLWLSTDAGYHPSNPFRNRLAIYFLPTTDEWYKAAYGSPSGTWYKYPTGSDLVPTAVVSGTEPNTAVLPGAAMYSADIDQAGGLSAWGTMAQGGNTWEWMESASDGVNDAAGEDRDVRGGSAGSAGGDDFSYLLPTTRFADSTTREPNDLGFRVVMIPLPDEDLNPSITSDLTSAFLYLGTPYSYAITANNSSTFYAAKGLPAGLKVHTKTGLISGKPSRTGSFTVTLQALKKGSATATATKVFTVVQVPTFSYAATINAKLNSSVNVKPKVAGYPAPTFSVVSGSLPPGLSLNSSTAAITGKPTTAGTYAFTVRGSNSAGDTDRSTTMVVK